MGTKRKTADQDQRDRAASDLGASYIVEAAAGTGKTTLLVTRILNLVKAGVSLERVAAITFTERAAADLKIKLRGEIEAALREGAGGGLADALADLERMQISTIHSFCAALLKERPVEAGVDPGFEVADGLTASLMQAEIWDAWLFGRMSKGDPALGNAVQLGVTIDQMRALAGALLDRRDVLGLLEKPEDTTKSVKRFLHDFSSRLERLEALAADHCLKPDEDRGALHIRQLGEALKALEKIRDPVKRELFITGSLKISRAGNKNNWKPRETMEEVKEGLGELMGLHETVKTGIVDASLWRLAAGLREFVGEYERAKQERNLLDFHDLLIRARDMLARHVHVRRYFQARFDHVLLDEFQDTDPLQAEIAFFLAEKPGGRAAAAWTGVKVDPGRIFLVGDPKQSIYRFRRADIETYAEARDFLGRPALLNIYENFRCSDRIVEAVNEIGSGIIRRPEDGAYQPDYVPLSTGRRADTMPPEHGVVLLYPPRAALEELTWAEKRRTWEARCLAAYVKSMVERERLPVWDDAGKRLRPVELRDIAVLMRTYTPVEFLEDAFLSQGIEFRVLGGKHFYKRQEVMQLLAVLRAVENPNDAVALVAALRSPFFGVSDEALLLHRAAGGRLSYLEEAQDAAIGEAFAALRELHGRRNDVAPARLLELIYDRTKALELFLFRPQGERRVANLLKIGDMARALARRGFHSFRSFVGWLSQRQEEEAEEEESPTVEAGDQFVRFLTIHKAKGLEFPVVCLCDLDYQGTDRDQVIIDRKRARMALKIGSRENRIQTAGFDRMAEHEKKRREAEEKRLLYVAMTRARDLLVLPVGWSAAGKKKTVDTSMMGFIKPFIPEKTADNTGQWQGHYLLCDTDALDLVPGDAPFLRVSLDPGGAPGKAGAAAAARAGWQESHDALARASAAGRPLKTATGLVEEAPEGTVKTGAGAAFGTLVHRLLEAVDWEHPEMLDRIAEAEGADAGIGRPMVREAVEKVRQTLGSPLIKRVLAADDYEKEVPFACRDGETVMEGVIDVVFRESGDVSIVDFKTDRIDGKDAAARAEHYRGQIEAYAAAIESTLGRRPKEAIVFFLHPMKPFKLAL